MATLTISEVVAKFEAKGWKFAKRAGMEYGTKRSEKWGTIYIRNRRWNKGWEVGISNATFLGASRTFQYKSWKAALNYAEDLARWH